MTETSRTTWSRAVVFGVAGALLVSLVVLAFLWPAKTSEPQNLPIGIAGPEDAVTAVTDALNENAPGTFDMVAADDRADAVAQIEQRETYGAIILATPPGAPEVLSASAASAAVAQMLNGAAAQLQAMAAQQAAAAGGDPTAVQVEVTDIVPLADSDPNGSGLVAAAFPMMLGGIIGGVMVAMLVVGVGRRLLALGGFAVTAGILLALILQTWFEFLQGDFWLNALALGTSILATAAFIVGFASLLGRGGLVLSVIVTILFANPISGAAVPWQFLAEPWGTIGQWFIPGASNNLLRGVSYFPYADAGMQWWILVGWIAVGLVLTSVGRFRTRPILHAPATA